jgi:hypothetical protein
MLGAQQREHDRHAAQRKCDGGRATEDETEQYYGRSQTLPAQPSIAHRRVPRRMIDFGFSVQWA